MVITVALIYSLFQILAIHTSTLRAQQKVELLLYGRGSGRSARLCSRFFWRSSYQQQAPQGDPNMGGAQGAGAQGGQQGDFVDADFTEVKDDDNK